MNKGMMLGVAKAEVLPFASAIFDLVTSFEVIEHIPNHRALLKEISICLKPGGLFILSTPNRNHPLRKQTHNPHHIHEFSYNELGEELSGFFEDVEVSCKYFTTADAERIAHRVADVKQKSIGVRILTNKNNVSRLIHLLVPLSLRDWYFRKKTGHGLHWYKPQHIRTEKYYDEETCYSFLARCMKL